ncbi:MAG: phosphoribulokinase [Bacillota bacterium]
MRTEPVLIGVAGDSGAGKSTLIRELSQLLGPDKVAVIGLDDYHSLNRQERKAVGITPLNPRANNLGLFIEHLYRLRQGEKVLKPVYDHDTGDFGDPEWVEPRPFIICEGLHPFCFGVLAEMYDYRVYYDTHPELKVAWKVQRDAAHRGYTVEQVRREIRQRQWDIRGFVEPQWWYADTVVTLIPPADDGSVIGVQLKEPPPGTQHSGSECWVGAQTLKPREAGKIRTAREWYGGREMWVTAITMPLTQEELRELGTAFGITEAVLRRVKGEEAIPFQVLLSLLAARLEQIRKQKESYGRERYAVGG